MSSVYRRGAEYARSLLGKVIDTPLTAKAKRAMSQERRYGPYEPGGDVHAAYLHRHNGQEFTGGAVCWDPAVRCEGICRLCPRENA